MSQKIYLGSDFLPCSLEDTDSAHEHSALDSKPPKMTFESIVILHEVDILVAVLAQAGG